MKDFSHLHIALIYLAVIRSSLLALLAMNVVTFFMYGIDKWKAKKSKWRIPEATLLGLAVLGGSGVRRRYFPNGYNLFGLPIILFVCLIIPEDVQKH